MTTKDECTSTPTGTQELTHDSLEVKKGNRAINLFYADGDISISWKSKWPIFGYDKAKSPIGPQTTSIGPHFGTYPE